MNTLLFLTSGLALLSFLRSPESEKYPSAILRECCWVFFGVCLFWGLGFTLRTFSPLAVLEIELLVTLAFFILNLTLQRDISMFAAICGLSFWILEHTFAWGRTVTAIISAGALYTAFRLAIWAFQNKALFYKPPASFAGYPALMLQAFWVSPILAVMGLFFI